MEEDVVVVARRELLYTGGRQHVRRQRLKLGLIGKGLVVAHDEVLSWRGGGVYLILETC